MLICYQPERHRFDARTPNFGVSVPCTAENLVQDESWMRGEREAKFRSVRAGARVVRVYTIADQCPDIRFFSLVACAPSSFSNVQEEERTTLFTFPLSSNGQGWPGGSCVHAAYTEGVLQPNGWRRMRNPRSHTNGISEPPWGFESIRPHCFVIRKTQRLRPDECFISPYGRDMIFAIGAKANGRLAAGRARGLNICKSDAHTYSISILRKHFRLPKFAFCAGAVCDLFSLLFFSLVSADPSWRENGISPRQTLFLLP